MKKKKVVKKKKGKTLRKKSQRRVIKKKPVKKAKRVFKPKPRIVRGVSRIIRPVKKIFKKKVDRVGTGIQGLDKMIQGGFKNESINLVAGGSGSGKSIFALQFLLEGVRKGEKVLYVTFEEKKKEFYSNMKRLGFDLESEEKKGNFIFLEYSPEKVKMMLDEGGGAIETLVFRHEIKRMVFDSITSFALLFDDELSKRQAMLGLFDIIRKWSCTTLLTVQYDPGDKTDEGISLIEFEADSIILLYLKNIKNKRQRFTEVLKMRGTNHSKEIHNFEIKNGIKIGSRAKIKNL